MPHRTRITASGPSIVALVRVLIVCVLVSACQGQAAREPSRAMLRGALEHGKPVSGELGALESRWVFSGVSGDQVSLTFRTSGAVLGAEITVLSPKGDAIARGRAGKTSDFRFRLPETGDYTVSVGPVTDSGDYTLSLSLIAASTAPTPTIPLTPTSQPGGTPIAIGQTQRGEIKTGDSLDLWSFDGTAGQVISIRMESNVIDPVLRLFAQDQTTLAGDDNPERRRVAIISAIRLPRTGIYYVQTWGNGRVGEYVVSVQPGTLPPTETQTPTPLVPTARSTVPPTATPTITPTMIVTAVSGGQLELGKSVRGAISAPDQAYRFVLFGPAGMIVSIGMFAEAGSTLIPSFEIYAPNGDQVAAVTAPDSVSGALFNGYALPATGAYIIFAHGAGTDAGKIGAYTLTVGESWTLREVGGGVALANQTIAGRLYRYGDRETWTYDLPANATISVEASAGQPTFNPVVEVVGPDDAQLAAVRGGPGGTAQVQTLTVRQAGRYRIRVTGFKNESVGTYDLVTRLLNIAPTATFSPIDASAQLALAQGEKYTYTFKASSGDLLVIEARRISPGVFDPIIELYGPSGRRVARADDVGAGNTDAVLQIALDDGVGEYKAVIYGYALMPGAFTLRVKVE